MTEPNSIYKSGFFCECKADPRGELERIRIRDSLSTDLTQQS
jgi:hypothetical protein